jgi:hypothetical protein
LYEDGIIGYTSARSIGRTRTRTKARRRRTRAMTRTGTRTRIRTRAKTTTRTPTTKQNIIYCAYDMKNSRIIGEFGENCGIREEAERDNENDAVNEGKGIKDECTEERVITDTFQPGVFIERLSMWGRMQLARSTAEIAGSNPTGGRSIHVCLSVSVSLYVSAGLATT